MRRIWKHTRHALIGLVILLVLLIAAGWIAFVPSPREPGYVFDKAWGGRGAGPGMFHDPTGIAVHDGRVYVADSRNGRIQLFDRDGRFLRKIGDGNLGRPMNLTVAAGRLYVADYWHDRITVLGLDGRLAATVGGAGAGAGRFDAPGGVAVSPDGDLYVADFVNHRVQKLDRDGAFLRQWGETGVVGIGAGRFNYPTDVALGPGGALYVADGYNDRIQVFAPDGRFSHKWGGPFATNIFGPFNGWFATVTGIAVDQAGNVFVADFYNHRVQKFTADGTFLTAFGEQGDGPGRFNHVMSVAVADDGTVYATDYGNNRVQRWRPKSK